MRCNITDGINLIVITIKEDVKMKKSKSLIVICVIIIGIIIVGLGIGYYILDNKDKQREANIRMMLEPELRLSDKTVEYGTTINLLDENEIFNSLLEDIEIEYEFDLLRLIIFVDILNSHQ